MHHLHSEIQKKSRKVLPSLEALLLRQGSVKIRGLTRFSGSARGALTDSEMPKILNRYRDIRKTDNKYRTDLTKNRPVYGKKPITT